MNKDKRYILEFVKNLSTKNYSSAEKALKMAVNEKIKDRIKSNLKQQ
jgi:hypothetical protein